MNYDAALKSVLQRQLLGGVLADRVGLKVTRWLNVEIPAVRTLRLDILGEAADGGLIHCEVQTRNEKLMRVRMAEYAFAVFRKYGRMPRQLVLYVGEAQLRMPNRLEGSDWFYRCDVLDARDLDAAALLESPFLADNVFAILARAEDQRTTVRQVLLRIAQAEDPDEREAAMAELLILARLRRLGSIIRQETKEVPISESLLYHELFAPSIKEGYTRGHKEGRKEGLEQGLEKGLEKGLEQGRHATALKMARLLISERFGRVPAALSRQLKTSSAEELEAMAIKVLKADSPADLLRP